MQILEITDKAVLCLNLMDEAERNEIDIDTRMWQESWEFRLWPPVQDIKREFRNLFRQLMRWHRENNMQTS